MAQRRAASLPKSRPELPVVQPHCRNHDKPARWQSNQRPCLANRPKQRHSDEQRQDTGYAQVEQLIR